MFSFHQKHFHLLLFFSISISCLKAQDITTPIADPSIKCDTCPCDTCPEPLTPPPLPPPPPPPIPECPPPPLPPSPPPPSPPPPPKEPPCIPCMSQPPPPKWYYSPNNNNLYVTEYNYSSGTRLGCVMSLMIVLFFGVAFLERIVFL